MTHPLILCDSTGYLLSHGTKSPSSYHTITPIYINICPLIMLKIKKASGKKQTQGFYFFIFFYFACRKNKLIL